MSKTGILGRLLRWFAGRPVVQPQYTVRMDVDPPSGGDDTAMIQDKLNLAVLVGAMLPANVEVRFPSGGTWHYGEPANTTTATLRGSE